MSLSDCIKKTGLNDEEINIFNNLVEKHQAKGMSPEEAQIAAAESRLSELGQDKSDVQTKVRAAVSEDLPAFLKKQQAVTEEKIGEDVTGKMFIEKQLFQLDARATAQKNDIGLYSAAEQAVLDMKLPAWKKEDGETNGNEIWNKLKSSAGIKKEELDWLGVEQFLKSKGDKGKFARDEVVDFIQGNGVVVEETVAEDAEDAVTELDFKETIWDDPEAWEHQLDDAIPEFESADLDSDVYWLPENFTAEWISTAGHIQKVRSYYGNIFEPEVLEEFDDLLEGGIVDSDQGQDVIDFLEEQGQNILNDMNSQMLSFATIEAQNYFEEQYKQDPYTINHDEKTDIYIFGNDDVGYQITTGNFGLQGTPVGDTEDIVYSLNEAEIQAEQYAREEGLLQDEEDEGVAKWGEYITDGYADNYREIKLTLPEIEGDFYNDVHFPDRNIVAFLRITDRDLNAKDPTEEIAKLKEEDPSAAAFYKGDAKKTYFIDEFQSDWHQDGRQKGYATGEVDAGEFEQDVLNPAAEALVDKLRELSKDSGSFTAEQRGEISDAYMNRADIGKIPEFAVDDEVKSLFKTYSEAKKKVQAERHGVPDAPFKGDAWMSLGIKRAIVDAIENGYEAIAWADSNVLTDRWSERYETLYKTQYDKKMPSLFKKATKIVPVHLNLEGEPHQHQEQGYWAIEITPELKDRIATEGLPLFQKEAKQARASIQFTKDNESIIRLTKTSDLSSFLHESGHLFLEMEKRFAAKFGLTDEHKKLLDWLGVKSFDEITVEHHEKFAETFEAYLREGKSPSVKLRDAFASFARWLTVIYQKLTDPRLTNVDLTPEIREYMDRMLATEAEIEQATANPAYDQLFKSKEQAGMTDEEWEKYQAQAAKAKDTATLDLNQKVIDEYRKRKTKEWAEERKPLIASEEERLSKLPVYEILNDLKEHPMDYDIVIEAISTGDEKGKLPGKLIGKAKKGGIDPAEYADAYGYPSVNAMVKAIDDAKPLKQAAQDAAQEQMIGRHGDVLNDGRIELEARDAIHNEEQAKLVLMEIKGLSKGKPKIDRAYLKQKAKEMIASMTWREMKPDKFYRAEIRAAQKAVTAESDEAKLEAKVQQLANHYLYKEAIKARDSAQKMRKHVRKVEQTKYTAKQVHPEYIRHLKLYTVASDFRANTRMDESTAIQKLRQVAQWAINQTDEALGLEIELYDDTLNNIIKADELGLLSQVKLKAWDDMTNDELTGIYDTVRHLRYVGGKLSENEAAKQSIKNLKVATSIRDNALKSTKKVKGSFAEKIQETTKGYAASILLHADSVLRRLDGLKDDGEAYNAIKRPLDKAVTEKQLPMQEKAGTDMDEIYHKYYTDSELRKMNGVADVDGLDTAFTKWEIIVMALNYGTESNRQALYEGVIEGRNPYTQETVETALNQHMEKRDWDFVQDVWAHIGSYKEEAFSLERKRKGVAPPAVEGIPVETKFGTIMGAYYALHYDPKDSIRVAEEEADSLIKNNSMGRFATARTRDGMMKARVGSGGRPILLDIMTWHKQINETINLLSMGEAVDEVQKVLSSKEFRSAMSETGNIEYMKALDVWLKDTAAGEVIAGDAVSRVLRNIRSGFSVSAIGWNFGTVLLQPLGIFQTMPVIGYKNTLKGVTAMARNPSAVIKDVQSRSKFMNSRGLTFNKDIHDTMEKLHGDPGKPSFMPDWMRDSMFYGIIFTQRYVDVATWLGAYEKAKVDIGADATESDLMHAADRAVARSQASGIWSDRTPIERGTISANIRQAEFVRIWTALGSYFFAKGNVAVEVFERTDFKSPKDVFQFSMDIMMLFVMEAVLVGLLRGTWPDGDDEETRAGFIAKEAAMSAIASYPLLREIGSEIQGFRGGSTIASFYETIGNASTQIGQGELDPALFKALNKVGGITFKYPSGAINRFADSMYKEAQGEDVDPIDYLMWRKKDK